MPLYKTISPNAQTTVKIWKITESYDDLLDKVNLNSNTLERVLRMKSKLHQCGFLSVRCLLQEFGYTDSDLFYDDFGKPHLNDGKQISITHSFIFSAIIISDQKVGIDIEMQRTKIQNIAEKFVDYEFCYLNQIDINYIDKLTVIWCVKESLYKLFETPGLSFKQHCLVIPFQLTDKSTVAWIDYQTQKHRYNIEFLRFEGFTCAYALA